MDEGQRARMAERIQTTLSAPVVLDGKELSVGVSCGCACYPEDGDASQVRIAADSRMYETSSAITKTTGRRESHEKQDPAPRRGDARPAADRGDGGIPCRRTASARAGRGAHHSQHRLVPADGRRARDVTLPATLPAEPGQTLTLYNDTLTDSDGGKVLSARGVEYDIEIRAGETLLYRYEDNAFPRTRR